LQHIIARHLPKIIADRALCIESEEWENAFKEDRINQAHLWPSLNSRMGKRLSDNHFIDLTEEVKFVFKKR
jgi:hypothetical protein